MGVLGAGFVLKGHEQLNLPVRSGSNPTPQFGASKRQIESAQSLATTLLAVGLLPDPFPLALRAIWGCILGGLVVLVALAPTARKVIHSNLATMARSSAEEAWGTIREAPGSNPWVVVKVVI